MEYVVRRTLGDNFKPLSDVEEQLRTLQVVRCGPWTKTAGRRSTRAAVSVVSGRRVTLTVVSGRRVTLTVPLSGSLPALASLPPSFAGVQSLSKVGRAGSLAR